MHPKQVMVTFLLLAVSAAAYAQQPNELQLKIDSTNRTLTVNAQDQVTVDPDVATLHIGFQTQPTDAKSAYASGADTSNAIINAVKQAGVPESAIRSEWQRLDAVYGKPHKFTLSQQWTVKVKPERVAEILDVAVTAGATDSGDIDWDVADEKALQDKALDGATARARAQAEVLAKGMGVHLGAVLYITNQVSQSVVYPRVFAAQARVATQAATPPPLAIEPHKVSASANVYAVFAID